MQRFCHSTFAYCITQRIHNFSCQIAIAILLQSKHFVSNVHNLTLDIFYFKICSNGHFDSFKLFSNAHQTFFDIWYLLVNMLLVATFQSCNGPLSCPFETYHETWMQNGLPSRIKHVTASACHSHAMLIFCNGLGAQSQPHLSMPNPKQTAEALLQNSKSTLCFGNEHNTTQHNTTQHNTTPTIQCTVQYNTVHNTIHTTIQ